MSEGDKKQTIPGWNGRKIENYHIRAARLSRDMRIKRGLPVPVGTARLAALPIRGDR